MNEPTIVCPNCHTEVRLTESLAAPLLEASRREYEQRLAQKDQQVAAREKTMREREAALAAEREQFEERVAQRLEADRRKITEEERKKARDRVQDEMERAARERGELEELLKERNAKLAEAQQAQAGVLRRERELEDARREIALTIEKQVQAGLSAARDKARQEAEEALKLKVAEKEQVISSMAKQIEELKRRAEQGSQQQQGEVQELELEELLRTRFPFDEISPVPKGEFGGDVVQVVRGAAGEPCGSILWEAKRTKHWSEGWLAKLRADQRAAKADVAVLVSHALPKGVDGFELLDDVWVVAPRLAYPVAMTLRASLMEVAHARQVAQDHETKAGLVYQYLTGLRFRQRVQGIVEAFDTLRRDLENERKLLTRQWAKREAQIDRVMQGTLGMYGDLQGIAGQGLQAIEGLEVGLLEDGSGTAIAAADDGTGNGTSQEAG